MFHVHLNNRMCLKFPSPTGRICDRLCTFSFHYFHLHQLTLIPHAIVRATTRTIIYKTSHYRSKKNALNTFTIASFVLFQFVLIRGHVAS
jgi:hypothetical protein